MGLPQSRQKGSRTPQPSSQKRLPPMRAQQLQSSFQSKNNQMMVTRTFKDAARQDMGVPGTKCFVGMLPYSKTENDLLQLFGSCGPVEEVVLLKYKATGEKKGAAIVRFATPQHAASAVTRLNGFLFNGATRQISVAIAQAAIDTSMGTFANGQGKRAAGAGFAAGPGCKLFVGQLPFSKSDGEIMEVFQHYGSVVEVALHRNVEGQKTGGAFVTFSDPGSAARALELSGYMFPGATRPIAVSLHASKKPRVA
jgi:RNA recognition motif-containing protein